MIAIGCSRNKVQDSMKTKQRFQAYLERLPGGLGWTIVRIPFDPADAWAERRGLRVTGTINGSPIRTSLFGFSQGGGHFLLVNKQMQKQAGIALGSTAVFVLEPDLKERDATVPAELARLLKQHRELKEFYDQSNPSARRDIARTLSQPKSAEARRRRAEQLAERMMLAMDGERELPPILQVAFRRNPGAKAGWEAMTPVQRRGHLLGIFYYQSPEAREKRAGKTVEEALKAAKAKSSEERT